jgi:hypothetical protein
MNELIIIIIIINFCNDKIAAKLYALGIWFVSGI